MNASKASTTLNAERSAPAAAVHSPAAPVALAQRLGNQQLQQLLQARLLQAKLTVSDPHDAFEQEADHIADQVMRMPDPTLSVAATVQRKCIDCEELRRSPAPVRAAPSVDAATESSIATLSGRGSALPESVRAFMEPRFKADFSGVRIHNDAQAHELARAVSAQAFTVGRNVVFGAGHYAPETDSGRRLLAHELTHVMQSSGTTMLRRKPDPVALGVSVPDPQQVKAFEPSVAYPWQNPAVRAKVFPHRESALRTFLVNARQEQLDAEFQPGKVSEVLLGEIGAEILAERTQLSEQMAEHVRERKQAQATLDSTLAQKRKHLADPQVRKQTALKGSLEQQRANLSGQAKAQQTRISQLENKGAKITEPEQKELDKRREMLEGLNEQLAPVLETLQEVSGELASGIEPFVTTETQARAEVKQHVAAEAKLKPQLDAVSGGVDGKKRASLGAAKKWRMNQYFKHLLTQGHDELLAAMLDEFDADATYTRYTKQDRYLLIHFSGMRYKSAHGTFARPQDLLTTLKEQELRELFAGADEAVLEDQFHATGSAVTAELAAGTAKPARTKELRGVKDAIAAPDTFLQQLQAKTPARHRAFSDWRSLIHMRAAALQKGDAEQVAELSEQIKPLEQQFGAGELKKLQTRLDLLERQQLEAVREFKVREARKAMQALGDAQALGVLQQMKDEFPAWVWDEVVRLTQLHVNVTDTNWKDQPGLPKTLDLKNPATARWKKILEGWTHNASQWNSKHKEKYEIVATSIVCNQLSELAQHLYGKDIKQGIRGAANWYHARAAEEQALGVARSYFMRPTRDTDFVPGAGLFWAHFETKLPFKENMAHTLPGIDFLTEGKQVMRDGLVEGDWTYHFASDGDITRTRDKDGKVETQWFAWQHEATVRKLMPGRVITFETSGGAREHSWTVSSLLDPMNEKWLKDQHADTNVFVGFAPHGEPSPALDESLRGILDGRDAL